MSAVDELTPFSPAPVEKPACQACKAFAPECLVPHGHGALACCWECTHHLVVHEISPKQCARAECECSPEEIYPKAVLERRRALREAVTVASVTQDATGRKPS